MPVLSQCVPVMNIVVDKKNTEVNERIKALDSVRAFVNQGKAIFGSRMYSDDSLKKLVSDLEKEAISTIWGYMEHIPEKYSKSCIVTRYSEFITFPEAELSTYPIVSLGEVIGLADKLNMVIVPIDYVDLKEISKSLQIQHTWSGYSHISAINCAEENLKKINQKSNMYILCPLAYYNFWLEIQSDKNIGKYAPPALESIFTTIDLMVPAQRNLYAMSKTNQENVRVLAQNLKDNVEQINSKLRNLESRVSKVEEQIQQIIHEQKEAKKRAEKEAREAAIRHAELMQLSYSMLDPLVFFVNGDAVDFYSSDCKTRKAHLVSCFGPEFPVEFFTMNGVTIHHDTDITKIPSKNGYCY